MLTEFIVTLFLNSIIHYKLTFHTVPAESPGRQE